MKRDRIPWFLFGFLALAGGNAVGAVYMFRGNVPAVMFGVFSMVSGYQIMHFAAHGEGMVTLQAIAGDQTESRASITTWASTVGLLVVSIYLIAQGFVIGSQATLRAFTMADMVLCGGAIVGGYITGHMAIHGVAL